MKSRYYLKRILLVLISVLILSAAAVYSAEESITLTTYYPSPYGVYSEMRLYPKADATCNDQQIGLMFYDNSPPSDAGLKVCGGTALGWIRITGGWSITGNSGTNPATNFIGTTDAQDWVIRTNNAERMRVSSSGDVGIGTNNPGTKLDVAGTVRATDFTCTDCLGPGDIGDGLGVNEIDENAIQRRVTGICAPGSSIRIIDVNGLVTCEADDTGGPGGGGNITITAPGGSYAGSSFDFVGNVTYSGGSTFTFGGGGGDGGGYWAPSGSNIYNTNGGNVGVGTAGPSQKLEVAGNVKAGRFTVVDTMYGGGPYYPAVGTDGTNTGVASGPGGNFYVLKSDGSYGNTYGNDYWIQAANGGAGAWASSLGGGGGGGGALGAWSGPYNVDTVYTAATDGFVTVTSDQGGDADCTVILETPVGAMRQRANPNHDGVQVAMMSPVRKGDTWIVRYPNTGCWTVYIYWIPLGS